MATSRLCVKGLPKHAGDDQLRKLFSEKGRVTDAKVARTRCVRTAGSKGAQQRPFWTLSAACRDGSSRQFAFVGFHTVEEAEAAQKYFDRTFMGTVRIAVEVRAVGGWPSSARALPDSLVHAVRVGRRQQIACSPLEQVLQRCACLPRCSVDTSPLLTSRHGCRQQRARLQAP